MGSSHARFYQWAGVGAGRLRLLPLDARIWQWRNGDADGQLGRAAGAQVNVNGADAPRVAEGVRGRENAFVDAGE